MRVLVTGAGGFIGHHLTTYLTNQGYWVRGVDIKEPDYASTPAQEFLTLDLRNEDDARQATIDVEEVYHLAADMGGIGYITASHADISRNNTLIDLQTLDGARANDVKRFLYASSACVYPASRQTDPNVEPLREADAWPADPRAGIRSRKVVHGRDVPVLPERPSTRDTRRAFPQRVRSVRRL